MKVTKEEIKKIENLNLDNVVIVIAGGDLYIRFFYEEGFEGWLGTDYFKLSEEVEELKKRKRKIKTEITKLDKKKTQLQEAYDLIRKETK